MFKYHLRVFTLSLIALMVTISPAIAQEPVRRDPIRVECGDIIEGEFSNNYEQHRYLLQLAPGDAVRVGAVPLGSTLTLSSFILGPTGLVVALNDGSLQNDGDIDFRNLQTQPSISTDPLSARGDYTLTVTNYEIRFGSIDDTGGVGVYTVSIGCTLRSGEEIAPGMSAVADVAPPDNAGDANPAPVAPPEPAFSGFGFPGLAPVDFSNVARLPIPPGIPLSGAITPNGSEILGYLFEANAGDTIALDFNRLSGDLNLGLVVIDSDSNIIFHASLVTGNTLSTTFQIPAGGEYTAGVFRIDLLTPDNPQATAFQVTATVNP